ncbi:conserved protein of unknown function [Magnetospira sp. QH-2]|nr:conserved protein of unknown function [Magnetospira sp. QH-2]
MFLVLGSCGFKPLYGNYQSGGSPSELAHIHIDPIEENIGQDLHNYLLDRMNPTGRPIRPLYRLAVYVKLTTRYLASGIAQETTRANVDTVASYTLTRKSTGRIEKTGKFSVTSSYNVVQSDFATEIADRSARRDTARLLADEITSQLAVHFIQRRDQRRKASPDP